MQLLWTLSSSTSLEAKIRNFTFGSRCKNASGITEKHCVVSPQRKRPQGCERRFARGFSVCSIALYSSFQDAELVLLGIQTNQSIQRDSKNRIRMSNINVHQDREIGPVALIFDHLRKLDTHVLIISIWPAHDDSANLLKHPQINQVSHFHSRRHQRKWICVFLSHRILEQQDTTAVIRPIFRSC